MILYGIFAQSIGGTGGSDIEVNIAGGIIQGGASLGAGVQIDGGADNILTNRGNISALSGTAIVGGGGNDTVNNYGRLQAILISVWETTLSIIIPEAVFNTGSDRYLWEQEIF